MQWMIWLTGGAIAVYLVALVPLVVMQRRLLYFPRPLAGPPANWGLPNAAALELVTALGDPLVAWYEPAASADKPLIVFFHGNGGNLADRVDLFRQFAAEGWGYLAIDYEGYGGSPGKPSEPALMRDGEAAYAKAIALGYPARRIVLFGESLGSAVAVPLAAAHPVGAVILDSAFSATVDVAAAHYWMFPVRLLLLDQFRSKDAIARVVAPKLFLHASEDPIVPVRFSRRLFAKAGQPKTFIVVEGRLHIVADVAFDGIKGWLEALPLSRLAAC